MLSGDGVRALCRRSIKPVTLVALVVNAFSAWEACALQQKLDLWAEMDEEYSKGKVAIVSDPDGFVNVRKAPDAAAEIVAKIQQDEFFLCRPDESEWWHVCDSFGNKGFMHHSRIKLAKDLSEPEVDRLFVNPEYATDDEFVGARELYLKRNGKELIAGDLKIPGINALHSNNDLQQFVFIRCYMDDLRETLLFSDNPPAAVLDCLEVYRKDGGEDLATRGEIKRGWTKLAAAAVKVPQRHFRTRHGLTLGDDIQTVIRTFGTYYNKRSMDDLDIYEWGFPGRRYYADKLLTAAVFDDDLRAHTFEDCLSQSKRFSLTENESRRLKSKLEDGDSQLLGSMPAIETKGPRVSKNYDYGFYATAFVRKGKLIALQYVTGAP